MKKLLFFLMFATAAVGQVQPTAPAVGNLNGNLYASGYGGWTVPQGNSGPLSWSSEATCTVSYGGTTFPAFTVGTPVWIYDQQTPAHNEKVTVTSVDITQDQCSIQTSTWLYQHPQFSLGSATAGLQEAINANLNTSVKLTVHLTADWFRLGGTLGLVTTSITGNANINVVDDTAAPSNWYHWVNPNYVLVTVGGSAGNLGTLQGDVVANNSTNSGAVDQNIFIAGAQSSGTNQLTPQQAINAAAANNGAVILQPGIGRKPFTNLGNYRVQDNRTDVPATARGVTEFGASCDERTVYGYLTQGSAAFSIGGGTLTTADIGKVIVAVGAVSGTPTVFVSTVTGITDSLHGTLQTAAPFTQATQHALDLGHDDTAAITQAMAAVGGGGTLVFPQGTCLTHTQTLTGQSPIGIGNTSSVLSFPGEDIFRAPDPSLTTGVNQGAAHIHDLTFLVDGRINATLPWQEITDTGTTAEAAVYRPLAQHSPISNNPLAPGWMVGASNGVALITAASAVICVAPGEVAPGVGSTVVFPYLPTVYTATVSSTSGSCLGGATPRTLSAALPTGSSNTQAEWFSGSSVQNLSVSIGSGACPSSITLANSILPVAGFPSNVAPFGLIQIDGEQFAYFGRSNAGNTSPANTLYGIQCAQNGTSRAAHSSAATVVPLNRFQPTYPWPVTPTPTANTTVPTNAGFFPGWNGGNFAFAFPVANGATYTGGTGAWSANAHIENLSFFPYPNDINGSSWAEVNNTGMIYEVTPSYATTFSNLFGLYLFYGLSIGPPPFNGANYFASQPTGDGTHYDGLSIWAANPIIIPVGNQNSFSNFNVYSNESTTGGTGLGADTCMYFNQLWNDQTGGYASTVSLSQFSNLYCEPEGGAHAAQMVQWDWGTINSEIVDLHMGGGGEVVVDGYQQHWFGGNFNNTIQTPVLVYGNQNTADYVTDLGSVPASNVYSGSSLINFGWGNRFSGTTSQSFSTPTGPYGYLLPNAREPIRGQTEDTFQFGNLYPTASFVSPESGFIYPEEFNSSFALESQAMSQGYVYDNTSPITHGYVGCNVGNNLSSSYCSTSLFNSQGLTLGPDQRLVNGKYILQMSLKDAVTNGNSTSIHLFSNCGPSWYQAISVPVLNSTWGAPVQATVDLTSVTGGSTCYIGVQFFGATTADQVQVGYMNFVPLPHNFQADTITVNNLITQGGVTGGTANGCQQSPVTGINGGYTCPTKGWASTLTADEGATDSSVALASTAGLSPAGCFFVDAEYECYAAISGSSLTGLTRGAYTTGAAAHNSGAPAVSISLVLGSIQQTPADVVAYGGTEAPILGVNNATPFNHGGSSVLSINNGGNETWVDVTGAIHQTNTGVLSNFNGSISVGSSLPVQPPLAQTGYLLQSNGPNNAYAPMSLGGGHAGSLNVITTPTIAAPTVFQGGIPSGANSASWVCSGTDYDGNLIPGTTTTLTGIAATWTYPQGTTVSCPWAAGVNTYSIWRTAGGGSQGLLASGSGPGFAVSDYDGATSGGTPPASNTSNPHISVAGTGTPAIQMGTVNIAAGSGAPASTCGTAPIGSGSLWLRTDGGASTSVYSCAGTTWTAVTIP